MLRATWRKALADTRAHRLQSALVVIILIAASSALALSLIVQQNADKPWRKAFDNANGAHLTYVGGANADLLSIATIEGVEAFAGPYPTLFNAALITQGKRFDAEILGVDAEPPAVGRPILEDGRWLAANAMNEIVLERSFADELNVEAGDTVQFKFGDAFSTFTVVGTAIDTGRGKFPDWSPGRVWAPRDVLPALEPDPSRIGQVLAVRLTDPEDASQFAFESLNGRGRLERIGVIEWTKVQEDMVEWNRINSVFLGVFSGFGLLAAGLIIANVIGGRVLAQFREIGILKATGFTPRQIAGIYLVQHLALALVSALIGVALALLIAPIYLRQLAETYNAATGSAFDPFLCAISVLAILVAVALFTLLPAWRGGCVSTVQAITTGFTPVGSRPSTLVRIARRLHLPAPVRVGVKDSFARPWRAVLTVAALSLTIVTITFTLGMEATFNRLAEDRGLVEEPWDIEISRTSASDAGVQAFLGSNPDVESYATSYWLRGVPAGGGPSDRPPFELRGLGGDVEHAGYPLIDGRIFEAPGEAIVGRVLAEELGLEIGDTIEIMAQMGSFEAPVTLTIVGTYVEPEEDGRVILFPLETAASLFPGLLPSTYEVMMTADGDWDGLITGVQAATNYEVEIDQREQGMPEEVTTIRGIMFGLSGLLLLIGLANMLTTTLLTVRERARDLGILKALGMTPRQVVGSVASGVSLLTLLGAVVGIPLGWIVYRGLFVLIGEKMAGADPKLYTAPAWTGLALIVPGALLFAVLTSIVPARRAARVPVTDVLRSD